MKKKYRILLLLAFGIILGGFRYVSSLPLLGEEEKDHVYSFSSGHWKVDGRVISDDTSLSGSHVEHLYNGDTDTSFVYSLEYPIFASHNSSALSGYLDRQMRLVRLEHPVGYYHAYFSAQKGNGYESIVYDTLFVDGENHKTRGKKVFLRDTKGVITPSEDWLKDMTPQKKTELWGIIDQALSEQYGSGYTSGIPGEGSLSGTQFAFSGAETIFFLPASSVPGKEIVSINIPTQKISSFLKDPTHSSVPVVSSATASLDGKKYVALTFDDGPNPKTTPRLLEILASKGVHATFYVLGSNVEHYPDIVQREVNEGHEIGNHSWNHPNFTKMTLSGALNEVQATSQKVMEVSGVYPKTLRPPYGAYTQLIKDAVDIPLSMWSVETLDWKYRNVQKNLQAALSQVRDGAIILFHDIHKESVDTIAPLIDELRQRGYEFVTVSELYQKYHGESMTPGMVCFSATNCR